MILPGETSFRGVIEKINDLFRPNPRNIGANEQKSGKAVESAKKFMPVNII